MPDDPIIPTLGQTIGAAKQRLVEVRPAVERHIENGRWSTVFAGYRAQNALVRDHLAKQVRATRLPFAEGQELTELAQSEFETPRAAGTTAAIGEVVLTRTVVHYVAGEAIEADDATDETTGIALLQAIAGVVNEHILDVYSPSTALGAHAAADASATLSVLSSTMGQLCTTANNFKTQLNRHLGNQRVSDGAALAAHLDADTLNAITTDDAFASASGSAFGSNSLASQQSLLLLVNATKAAYNAHVALEARGGTIRAGHIFRLAPAPTAVPSVAGGEYVVTLDTQVTIGAQTVAPPIEAIVDGPAQNVPTWSTGGPTLALTAAAPLYDSGATLAFVPTDIRAAGGSSGQPDPELRAAATAAWTGSYGPTTGAIVAGMLRSAGVSRAVVLDDTSTGRSVCYATDVSWAWSNALNDRIQRELRDEWAGAGCRVTGGQVSNRRIRVLATIALRDARYLVEPTAITTALRAAARAYFNDRPDWYIWRENALRAKLSRASRRILRCTSVSVRDHEGKPITEPSLPTAGDTLVHWYLADDALDVTYTGPT